MGECTEKRKQRLQLEGKVDEACENDDMALLDETISEGISMLGKRIFYDRARRIAIKSNSITVLSRLIDCDVSVKTIRPTHVTGAKTATLEFLLAHGWDINYQWTAGPDFEPYMWHCVHDEDMIKWCLEHGASIHPPDQLFKDIKVPCDPILEKVAAWGNIATFELLRSKGAPCGSSLHVAVQFAVMMRPKMSAKDHKTSEKDGESESEKKDRLVHEERMAMVRYLLDVVGLDVNAPDGPPESNISGVGTPICYILLQGSMRELTWLLLDRGADPTPALHLAETWIDGGQFVLDVEAWKAQRAQQDQKGVLACLVQ
jgi:hypothetical protein